MSRIIFTKDNCRIERTDMYLVRATMSDGTVYENLEPRRLFPLTDLDHYITFLDEGEHEVAMLTEIKKFCNPKEQETIDNILNIMCVMDNYELMLK